MSRQSGDEVKDGRVYNGFDDSLQVWVTGGRIVRPCGHPARMRELGPCCTQWELAGQSIYAVQGAQER